MIIVFCAWTVDIHAALPAEYEAAHTTRAPHNRQNSRAKKNRRRKLFTRSYQHSPPSNFSALARVAVAYRDKNNSPTRSSSTIDRTHAKGCSSKPLLFYCFDRGGAGIAAAFSRNRLPHMAPRRPYRSASIAHGILRANKKRRGAGRGRTSAILAKFRFPRPPPLPRLQLAWGRR